MVKRFRKRIIVGKNVLGSLGAPNEKQTVKESGSIQNQLYMIKLKGTQTPKQQCTCNSFRQ